MVSILKAWLLLLLIHPQIMGRRVPRLMWVKGVDVEIEFLVMIIFFKPPDSFLKDSGRKIVFLISAVRYVCFVTAW